MENLMIETMLPLDDRPAAPAPEPTALRYPVGAYTAVPLLAVVVYGLPIAQGSLSSGGGPGRPAYYSNAKTLQPWREDVEAAIRRAAEAAGLRVPLLTLDPVVCEMTFTLPRPKSAPKTRRTYPTSRPDWDKLARSVSDAVTTSGLFRDDSQIVEGTSRKVFPSEHPLSLPVPGVRFTIGVVVS